ncbi:MAG: DUF2651 domain-containing protein [Shouchella clausii]|jgi:hypothetical protein
MLPYIISLLTAILLTSFAYFLGDFFLEQALAIWHPLLIGASVVVLGAVVEKLRSPMWLIIVTPFPIGMTLLFLFLKSTWPVWLLTYVLTLAIYVIIHMIASSLFRFHSLIPAWKLSKTA